MQIGKVNYNDRLKSLTWLNFKKFWNEGEVNRVGLTAEEAAKIFGIKVPVKTKKGN